MRQQPEFNSGMRLKAPCLKMRQCRTYEKKLRKIITETEEDFSASYIINYLTLTEAPA